MKENVNYHIVEGMGMFNLEKRRLKGNVRQTFEVISLEQEIRLFQFGSRWHNWKEWVEVSKGPVSKGILILGTIEKLNGLRIGVSSPSPGGDGGPNGGKVTHLFGIL